jgi:hypothetical protein
MPKKNKNDPKGLKIARKAERRPLTFEELETQRQRVVSMNVTIDDPKVQKSAFLKWISINQGTTLSHLKRLFFP